MEEQWWKLPSRVIQMNLQVMDTPQMSAERLAQDVCELGGNVLVINVGGIYAWYPSKVPYHHVNEWLPGDRDLLGDIVEECHKKGVYVAARFDFSKADDSAYLQKPQWFVRNPDGTPHAYGMERPGPWSILYSTCINGGYRNHEAAVPILKEALEQYEFDGVFLNAPNYEPCFCESCRVKYRELFGEELPMEWERGETNDSPTFARRPGIAGIRKEWESLCCQDNIRLLRETIKEVSPSIPLILYFKTCGEDLDARSATADVLCAEAQNVLSQGKKNFTPFWLPTLNAKYGAVPEHMPAPFGIIHSCPGMDWRHTGLPAAEYRSWMSRVAANGANLWHSLTGFKETIGDERIRKTVQAVNRDVMQAESAMTGAKSAAQILLVWNGSKSAKGWLGGLLDAQIQFDVEDEMRFNAQRASRYQAVIVPAGGELLESRLEELKVCLARGARLLIEECRAKQARKFHKLLGIREEVQGGGELAAAYWRFERDELQTNLKETELLPHRGETLYCTAADRAVVEASLVPPFAPLDAVGAPPERASLPAPHTKLPLCITHDEGEGAVLYLPFAFGSLLEAYGLPDDLLLLGNMMDWGVNNQREFKMEPYPGLEAVLYHTKSGVLLHLVNSVGRRPLMKMLPLVDVKFELRLPSGVSGAVVNAILGPGETEISQSDDVLTVTAARVNVWSVFEITWEKDDACPNRTAVPLVGNEL